VKVLDFVLSKVTSGRRVDGSLTREGEMLGTPDSGHCTRGVQWMLVGVSDRDARFGGTHELIEVDQYLKRQEQLWEQARQHTAQNPSPVVQRLRALSKVPGSTAP